MRGYGHAGLPASWASMAWIMTHSIIVRRSGTRVPQSICSSCLILAGLNLADGCHALHGFVHVLACHPCTPEFQGQLKT